MAPSELSQTFLAFREQCEWIQTCFNTNRDLFGSGRPRLKLLEDSAKAFFLELNRILIDNLILQICKITDPATTIVKKVERANLTVHHINALLKAEGLLTAEIEAAAMGIARYRAIIQDSRNKLISHLDKETVLTYITVGQHTRQDVEQFFEDLYTYVDAVGNAVGVGPLDFKVTSGPGDVADLLRALNGGTYVAAE